MLSRLGIIKRRRKTTRGQSLVEFALIGVILFAFLMGIMDGARLLFTYSVVSNAAQEGVRYSVLRPRDVLNSTDATQVAANQTLTPAASRHTYIAQQVVPDGSCSGFAKTRTNVFGITKSEVQVSEWYDDGDGTPLVVATPADLENAAIPGNRVVVEATYNFSFISPYMKIFTPNGLNVTMRSARTMLSAGRATSDGTPYNCTVNYTPAPTYTPSNTPTRTSTPTNTATSTFTPTPTATPNCGLSLGSIYVCRTSGGGGQPWQATISIFGYQTGDAVTIAQNSSGAQNMTCNSSGVCTYSGSSASIGDTVVFTLIPAGGRACGPLTLGTTISNTCGVNTATPTRTATSTSTSTITNTPTPFYTWTVSPTRTGTSTYTRTPTTGPTNTQTPTNTPTNTFTPTNTRTSTNTSTPLPTFTPTNTYTPTSTPTITPTRTITLTPTATPFCPVTVSISAIRDGTNSSFSKKVQVRATAKDFSGKSVSGLTISATTGTGELISLSEISPGTYGGCSSQTYNQNTTVNVSASGSVCSINYSPGSSVTTLNGTITSCP